MVEALVRAALEELALEGPGSAPAGCLALRRCACLPQSRSNSHYHAGCFHDCLLELVEQRLPIAGITTLSDSLKRRVWIALLRKPGGIVRVPVDQCATR